MEQERERDRERESETGRERARQGERERRLGSQVSLLSVVIKVLKGPCQLRVCREIKSGLHTEKGTSQTCLLRRSRLPRAAAAAPEAH